MYNPAPKWDCPWATYYPLPSVRPLEGATQLRLASHRACHLTASSAGTGSLGCLLSIHALGTTLAAFVLILFNAHNL